MRKCRVVEQCQRAQALGVYGLWNQTPGLLLCFSPTLGSLEWCQTGLCTYVKALLGIYMQCTTFEERKALMAFFPFLPSWSMPVLFFCPMDKHHFLVSHDSIARFGQDLAKGKKGQMLWGGLCSGLWPLGPPCFYKNMRDARDAQSLCRKGEEPGQFYSLDLVMCCLGWWLGLVQGPGVLWWNHRLQWRPAVLPPLSGSLLEAPV